MNFRAQFHSYRSQIQENVRDFLCPRHWFLIDFNVVTVESSSRQVNWEFQLTITS